MDAGSAGYRKSCTSHDTCDFITLEDAKRKLELLACP